MLDPSRYRVQPDTHLDLSGYDPNSRHGFGRGKRKGKAQLPKLTARLADLQRRLWAESQQKLLVVLQAMDTGGKDGTIRHVFKGVNPQGVQVRSFGTPSEWELAHDYLWRAHFHTPGNGAITIFNRSHYEDVLIARVQGLVPEERWRRRYGHITDFERMLNDEGTTIVKIFLHISKDEQRKRLQARLDQPDKRWKFARGDLDDRKLWDDYIEAYEEAISRTSTDRAPWYIVPANRKWYRNLVVSSILIDHLERMDPQYPPPEDDLDDIVIV
jgi:PPK2 family polyphosphate:nucleotide phosphotransferase